MPPELFPRPTFSLNPEAGRTGPKLWVKRIVIWREPNVVLRDIPMRPGFNIVWSPDSQTEDSPIGHGGGKTTFCRLFRFCLGEDTFASDDLRHRIGEVFPKGCVGAEIILDSKVWIVLRSLGHRRRDVVQEGGSLDDLFSGEHQATGMAPLVDAITQSILGDSPKLMPSSIGSESAWKALLAWITRDQECRFSHVLNWRSPESNSSSPVVNRSGEDKLLVVRAILGALSINEVAAQQQEELQSKNVTGKKSDLDRLKWQLERARVNVYTKLRRDGEALSGTPVDVVLLKKAATEQFSKALNLPERVSSVDVEKARRERDVAKNEFNRLQGELKLLNGRIEEKQKIRPAIAAELPEAHARLLNENNPVCPICKVGIDKALAEGCGISTETCDLHSLQMEISRKRELLRALEQEISSLRQEEPALNAEVADAQNLFDELDASLRKIEQSMDVSSKSVRESQKLSEDVEEYEALLAEYDEAQSEASKNEDALEKTRLSIAKHRDASFTIILSLSNWFDIVLRELVPGDIRGSAKLDGNGLKLNVELGGYRSTVAIESLKVVAFDLAVLAMSMEKSLYFPGVLIHDSPREADLSEEIYKRLFLFAEKLEKSTSAPLFQYILTTTTAPPKAFQTRPWLCLEVKGAPAEQRLLKVDL
ncbi:MAG: hypothetical protein JWQ42_2702 [Edaphobacter sp.]|nr:hypothetical protein [Edaphobacter sp.]